MKKMSNLLVNCVTVLLISCLDVIICDYENTWNSYFEEPCCTTNSNNNNNNNNKNSIKNNNNNNKFNYNDHQGKKCFIKKCLD